MLAVMSDEVSFAPDLYRGTAAYYDEFRLPYPATLISDLTCRASPWGRGRLLDLACGTGQLAFALCDSFAEVWAVDQEPDMVEVVAAKAGALGGGASGRSSRAPRTWTFRLVTSSWLSSATRSTGSGVT
jgi:SAM-dependent methyltransferase